uniref:Uncharacterized protein n=1 Tax=Dulem virus 94 TaxID=3145805 RepID=A0AAU8B2L5_9VIRU
MRTYLYSGKLYKCFFPEGFLPSNSFLYFSTWECLIEFCRSNEVKGVNVWRLGENDEYYDFCYLKDFSNGCC